MKVARRLVPTLLLVLLAAAPAPAGEDPGELAAIEKTLRLYIDGGRLGDLGQLREAFHPSARLQFVKEGSYQEWTLNQYLGWKTPGEKLKYQGRILSIDYAGSTATAKLEAEYDTHRFIDYMSLLKIEGRWRIVNKIFHRAPK